MQEYSLVLTNKLLEESLMDNYPDDIRKYDSDPRSPFYVEPIIRCKVCDSVVEEGEGAEDNTWGWLCDECLKENAE
jgi:hypothetical protein